MTQRPPLRRGVVSSERRPGLSYVADCDDDVERFIARSARLTGTLSNPFHHPHWLRAWYRAFASGPERRPLFVGVRERDSGVDVMLLPLVRRRWWGVEVVEFADAGVTDYVMPLCSPHLDAAGDPAVVGRALWRALRGQLGNYGVFLGDKMLAATLEEDDSRRNPLMEALHVRPSRLFGNMFTVSTDWSTWRRSLEKSVRKEIERCWRVFERSPSARFERVIDPERALALLETLERQQSERLRERVDRYVLDRPDYRLFYRLLLEAGIGDGSVVLTALCDGDLVVSALFGIANGRRYVALRQSIAGDAVKHLSPARLLDEGTARHLHQLGLCHFDFGIGNYRHKTVLGMRRIPLFEFCRALSWRGLPLVAWWWTRRRLRESRLLRLLRRRR